MAYDASTDNDDENDQPVSTGGAVSSQSDGSTPTGQAQQRATPSNKPNVQQYLRANQGAGQQLASGIEGQANKQANQFNNQVQKSSNVVNSQSNPLEQKLGQQGQNLIQQSFKDPSAILNNQDQLNQFQKLRDQGYQGDIGNLQNTVAQNNNQLQGQLSNIQSGAQGAGTENGRFNLLRQRFAQPTYSAGQQKLDNLFLQAQPTNLQQNLTNTANQAAQGFNAASNASQNKLNALTNMSQQNANTIQSTFGKDIGDINTAVTGNQDALYKNLQTELPAMQAAAAGNTLTPDQAKKLGLDTALNGGSTWGVDLSKYINNTDPSLMSRPSLAQAATQQQLDRYSGLNSLLGNTNPDIFNGEKTAGGYNPYDVRTADLVNDVNSAKTNANNRIQQDIANTFAAYGLGSQVTNNANPNLLSSYGTSGFKNILDGFTNKGFASADPGAERRAQAVSNLSNIVQNDANDPGKLAQDYHNWWDQAASTMGMSPQEFRNAFGIGAPALNSNDAYTNSGRFNSLMNNFVGTGKV